MTQEPPSDDPVLPPHPDSTSADWPGSTAGKSGQPAHAPEAVQTLRRAMRRARFDDAERVGVQADLRTTQIGRLELLQDALNPLLAQIPKNVDLFDVGLMPGTTPRLFIDMIGFVEMGRDARVYRFLQDTRHSRITLAETTDVGTIVDAITNYVARRLLERDKALAADELGPEGPATPAPAGSDSETSHLVTGDKPSSADKPRRRVLAWSGAVFAFIIDLLGAITFFTILAVAAWALWTRLHGQV